VSNSRKRRDSGGFTNIHRHAKAALDAAIVNDLGKYAAAMNRLDKIEGGHVNALIVWCDAALDATGHTMGASTFRPAWMAVDDDTAEPIDGRINPAENVRPEVRWAGQLIAARANDDEPMFRALLVAADRLDHASRCVHINTAASTCALTIRRARVA
jgi:hypothetical protein